jgi:exodeoxyribonuclease VII large subunit
MTLRVTGSPRLHPQFGFSVTVQAIALAGEGTIKKAFELLLKKLTLEGLFQPERKRQLPYPPKHVGLITSSESAAYADFIKVINARWMGMKIEVADVQVQGEPASGQIVRTIEYFNAAGEPPEVLVIIRGGGSADDLQTFNTEVVTRAVAASRIPTVVAIGHEVDTSLAELAADLRASTPSNAAELLVPDRKQYLKDIVLVRSELGRLLSVSIQTAKRDLKNQRESLGQVIDQFINQRRLELENSKKLAGILNPTNILKRGYSVVRKGKAVIRSSKQTVNGDKLEVILYDGIINVEVQ